MKVYVKAPPRLSRAMSRVAFALERFAPPDVQIVEHQEQADLLVLHVIGLEAIEYRKHQRCAVLQYCTGAGDRRPWYPLWERSVLVWSYYDLQDDIRPSAFYHAPLGIDAPFRQPFVEGQRNLLVMTSGYVNGNGQEAIEEPHVAAQELGWPAFHLGPYPSGLTRELKMDLATGIGDAALAALYRQTNWVAGLRFVEGFEMPAIEGLACGARPIVFDRTDNVHWYGDTAVYVPECSGQDLIDILKEVYRYSPRPVSAAERTMILERFHWPTLVGNFWRRVKENV